MEPTRREDVYQLLREVGEHVIRPTRIAIGGSIALILSDVLSRATEDIDLVDEVPTELRSAHDLLERLAKRYRLQITHFQSHYLPSGWQDRVHSFDKFGQLTVFIVDAYDIFVGKLFSAREKDLDDLRALMRSLDHDIIRSRWKHSAAALRGEAKLAEDARRNWYILFGEPLPDCLQ